MIIFVVLDQPGQPVDGSGSQNMQSGASIGNVGPGRFGIGMGPGTPGMSQGGVGIGPSNPSMNQGLGGSSMGIQSPGSVMMEAGRPAGNMNSGHMMPGMVNRNS